MRLLLQTCCVCCPDSFRQVVKEESTPATAVICTDEQTVNQKKTWRKDAWYEKTKEEQKKSRYVPDWWMTCVTFYWKHLPGYVPTFFFCPFLVAKKQRRSLILYHESSNEVWEILLAVLVSHHNRQPGYCMTPPDTSKHTRTWYRASCVAFT